jgi:hypothetical protein
MLDLCTFRHKMMTQAAISLMIRNMSQRVACFEELKGVQILVFPAAVTVYEETQFAIRRLGALNKGINSDLPEAYAEAISLLDRLASYLVQSTTMKREIVQKNQTIMLNLDIDRSLRAILNLPLERDTSRRYWALERTFVYEDHCK